MCPRHPPLRRIRPRLPVSLACERWSVTRPGSTVKTGEGKQIRQPHAHFFAGAAAKIRSANGHNGAATSGSAP